MGFNTKSKKTSQSNVGGKTTLELLKDLVLEAENDNSFQIGGLVFDSEDDYLLLKNVDDNIKQTAKLFKNGSIDLEEYFDNIKTIRVKENYLGADDEIEVLFKNASYLLYYDESKFDTDCKVARCFFNKIEIEYLDSDSESDIDFDLDISSDDDL